MHLLDDDVARVRRPSNRVEGAESGPGRSELRSDHRAMLRLQRDAGNAAVAQLVEEGSDPHGLQRVLGSGGQPLDSGVRGEMESAIGADFSDVRVHTGGDADKSAKSLGANAYTSGSDLVFAEGKYDPSSDSGRHTLAHELTHVVQQRSGPVDGEMTGTGVRVSDPSDRFEKAAEANADRVLSGQGRGAGSGGATTAQLQAGPSVQRAPEEEVPEEEQPSMQGEFVQRESPEEEEMNPG